MLYSECDVVLIGAGGHARVIIDIITSYHKELNIIGLLDSAKDKQGSLLDGFKILGDDTLMQKIYNEGIRKAFIALGTTGDYKTRLNLYRAAREIGFDLINVIHGHSCISENTALGAGNAVMAHAVVNPGVNIGNNCIINSGSIIEHECIIGENTHIATGARLAGNVHIGANCMIGMASSIIQGVKIGDRSVIGAGSVVIRDIPEDSVAVGVPARVIKRRSDV